MSSRQKEAKRRPPPAAATAPRERPSADEVQGFMQALGAWNDAEIAGYLEWAREHPLEADAEIFDAFVLLRLARCLRAGKLPPLWMRPALAQRIELALMREDWRHALRRPFDQAPSLFSRTMLRDIDLGTNVAAELRELRKRRKGATLDEAIQVVKSRMKRPNGREWSDAIVRDAYYRAKALISILSREKVETTSP